MKLAMRLTRKEWRIVERALLKFATTLDDDGDAPETNEEIDDLWAKVSIHREQNGLLYADELRARKNRRAP